MKRNRRKKRSPSLRLTQAQIREARELSPGESLLIGPRALPLKTIKGIRSPGHRRRPIDINSGVIYPITVTKSKGK